MKLWKYGDLHKKYPVAVGDVWIVGPAKYICGDLEADPSVLLAELKKSKPDLMYVDPPWDNRIANEFRKRSGLDEAPRQVEVTNVIRKIISYARDLKILALMEGGHKRREMNRQCVAVEGGRVGAEWTIHYSQKKMPCALFAVDFREEPKNDYPNFDGLSEVEAEDLAMSHYKPKLVFDPCGGLGGTPAAATYAGIPSISHELSPYKMATALDRISQMTGETARKVFP